MNLELETSACSVLAVLIREAWNVQTRITGLKGRIKYIRLNVCFNFSVAKKL